MKRVLFLIYFTALAAVSLFSQSDLQPAAIVNLLRSEPITVRQLRSQVEQMERTTRRTLSSSERLQVLDAMINERLVLQAAERERITITENELNNQLQQLRNTMAQQMGRPPNDAEFAQAIRNESGLEMQAFRTQLRNQMISQKFLMAKKGNIISAVTQPTETEVLERFELERTQFIRPQTVRFSMIQIPFGQDAASRVAARQLADRLIREIGSSPSRFDEAVASSQAPNSGYRAGDGGYLPRNREARNMVGANFMNTAFNTRQGEVSRLIEGAQGFNIIKITENYTLKILELDDVVQPGSRITVRNYISQALMAEKTQAALAQASQELVSELRAGRTVQVFDRNIAW